MSASAVAAAALLKMHATDPFGRAPLPVSRLTIALPEPDAPMAPTAPVLDCASANALVETSSATDKQVMIHRMRAIISHGFRVDHMRRAGYPYVYIEVMRSLEAHRADALPKWRAKLELIPYEQIAYNPSMSPHVVCPRCKGYFAMCKSGRIRRHMCRADHHRGRVPVLATVVRSSRQTGRQTGRCGPS